MELKGLSEGLTVEQGLEESVETTAEEKLFRQKKSPVKKMEMGRSLLV